MSCEFLENLLLCSSNCWSDLWFNKCWGVLAFGISLLNDNLTYSTKFKRRDNIRGSLEHRLRQRLFTGSIPRRTEWGRQWTGSNVCSCAAAVEETSIMAEVKFSVFLWPVGWWLQMYHVNIVLLMWVSAKVIIAVLSSGEYVGKCSLMCCW